MRIAQFKTAATCIIVINVILIAIGTFLTDRRTVKTTRTRWRPNRLEGTPTVSIKKVNHSSSGQASQELPPIIKLPPPTVAKFSRTKWSDDFTFDKVQLVRPSNFTVPDTLMRKDFVLAIPTIARGSVSYLHDTLHSLIENLQGFTSVVILVYIGEEDRDVADKIASGIKESFPTETGSGLIHIVLPPEGYYPSWNEQLRQSFNDDFKRVKWRSKQNLDQIFLMTYSYFLQPKYYLMLEDDIVAAKGYLPTIYEDAESKKDRNFVLISYCQLGAIGKLIRRDLLPSLIKYFQLFWSDKPLDWLIFDYLRGRVCDMSKTQKA